jgi:excisionase family DNA binding protein
MAAARPETTGRKLRGHSHDQTDRLVYTIPEAGRLLGLSRNASYEAAKRGEIPTLRIGRLLLVPKGPFHRMVELTAVPAKKSDSSTAAAAEEVAKP